MLSSPVDTSSETIESALDYLRRGWSVIPIRPRDKKPLIKWEKYQQERATEDVVRGWFENWPDANIGIVTGSVSGMIVLDFDGPEGLEAFQNLELRDITTPIVQTGNGTHCYLLHPSGDVRNYVKRLPGMDVRAEGGYVVAPPSIHQSGKRYAFLPSRGPGVPLASTPPSVMALLTGVGPAQCDHRTDKAFRSRTSSTAPYARSALEREAEKVVSAPEGRRNDTLNAAAFSLGQLVGSGDLHYEEVERVLLRASIDCGLSEPEARRTIKSGIWAGITTPRAATPSWHRDPRQPNFVANGDQDDPQHRLSEDVHLSDYRLDRLAAGEPPRREWLVTNAIPLGGPGVLFGAGGIGKSMAALDLCLKIGTRSKYGSIDQETFLGLVPEEAAGAAVFITLEDDRAEIHRRTANLDPHNERDGAPCYVLPSLDLPGFDPALIRQEGRMVALTDFATNGLDELLFKIKVDAGCPVRLLMLDPAGDLIEGDEDSASTVKPLMRRLREIATRHRCTVILLGHVAKGETDSNNIGVKGMRGSGAWVANARFAIGVFSPPDNEKAAFLRRLSIEPSPANLERVVYGRFTKTNFPGAPSGVLRFLRDPQTGKWINYSAQAKSEAEAEHEAGRAALVEIVRKAAGVGLPFQVAGSAGLYKRRADLPAPLATWGQKRLERLANEALERGLLVKCRAKGSAAPCWLDTPAGPYATGEQVEIGMGSLSDLLTRGRGE